jgi:DNA-binding NarL/FixJ family response regulator
LGKHAVGFGKTFERRVHALFDKGLTDAAIARALDVDRSTVTHRTMHWRKRKRRK